MLMGRVLAVGLPRPRKRLEYRPAGAVADPGS